MTQTDTTADAHRYVCTASECTFEYHPVRNGDNPLQRRLFCYDCGEKREFRLRVTAIVDREDGGRNDSS